MITATTRTVACARCGRSDRVVADDGPPICVRCILAWGSYARLAAEVTGSEPERRARVAGRARDGHSTSGGHDRSEPAAADHDSAVAALLHWTHRAPVAGCPLCGGGD